MKKFLFFLLIISVLLSCEKEDSSSIKQLTYVKSINIEFFDDNRNPQNLEVSDDGTIFVSFRGAAANSPASIYQYNFDGSFEGVLDDTVNGSKVYFYSFFIDLNNHLQIPSSVKGKMEMREYDVEGKFINSKSLSSYTDTINLIMLYWGNYSYTVDNEGNIFSVPGNFGSYPVIKVNPDYTQTIKYLEEKDVENLFPGQNGTEILLTDIIVNDNRLYVTVDRTGEDEDKDKDGVLILDNNFNRISYLGDNWMFNGPHAVGHNNGYLYVASMYSKELKVFDSNMELVALVTNEADNDKLGSPREIAAKGEYVYILDYNNSYVIHIYESL